MAEVIVRKQAEKKPKPPKAFPVKGITFTVKLTSLKDADDLIGLYESSAPSIAAALTEKTAAYR